MTPTTLDFVRLSHSFATQNVKVTLATKLGLRKGLSSRISACPALTTILVFHKDPLLIRRHRFQGPDCVDFNGGLVSAAALVPILWRGSRLFHTDLLEEIFLNKFLRVPQHNFVQQ